MGYDELQRRQANTGRIYSAYCNDDGSRQWYVTAKSTLLSFFARESTSFHLSKEHVPDRKNKAFEQQGDKLEQVMKH